MPRSKRHAPRCQSTRSEPPIEFGDAFDITGPSEPVPEVPHGQLNPPTQPESFSQREPSTQQEPSSQPNLPSSRRKSNRYWTVNLIDDDGVVKEAHVKVQDVFVLTSGQRVVLEWNQEGQPIGEAAGLLGGFLGHIASNFSHFPISYEKWPKVPMSYKEHVWNTLIKEKFQVFDGPNKIYILGNLGKKWKDNRVRLFQENYDPLLSWEANIERYPNGVSKDQWAAFLTYRLSDTTKMICEKNAANRSKQKIPHTLGSMSFARKRNEIEIETKRPCSRADFYPISHQKKDGTFVNDEARQKCEELRVQTQLNEEGDAFTHVFGEEHSGRVRGFGYGVCPSQIFGSARRSVGCSSSTCQYKAEYEAKISEMEGRIEAYNTKVNKLETTLAYVLEHVGAPLPPGFPSTSQEAAVGSLIPPNLRSSSSDSHEPPNHAPISSHP